jgi:hypothetical protein
VANVVCPETVFRIGIINAENFRYGMWEGRGNERQEEEARWRGERQGEELMVLYLY